MIILTLYYFYFNFYEKKAYRSELKHFEAVSKPPNVFDKFNKEKSVSFLVEYNETNQKKKLDLIVEEKEDPIEDIKMGGILEELLVLLFRLELDRRRTEHRLNIEKANFAKLKSQIENISYKRAVGNLVFVFKYIIS